MTLTIAPDTFWVLMSAGVVLWALYGAYVVWLCIKEDDR